MSLFDRLTEMGKAALTTDVQLQHQQAGLNELRMEFRTLAETVQKLGERVTRLETQRESDLARLQIEVERAEMRLSRQLSPSN